LKKLRMGKVIAQVEKYLDLTMQGEKLAARASVGSASAQM
jgi:hypothetical protein